MSLKFSFTLALTALLVIIFAVTTAVYLNYYSIPRFDFAPIQTNSPLLTEQDVETILSKHFKTIRRVRQIPPTIKRSFSNVAGVPFDMRDPGEPISTDLLIPGVSSRRLIFAALADNSVILAYEQGGFVDYEIVVVLSFTEHKGVWAADLNSGAVNIDGLRTVIRRGRFRALSIPYR